MKHDLPRQLNAGQENHKKRESLFLYLQMSTGGARSSENIGLE